MNELIIEFSLFYFNFFTEALRFSVLLSSSSLSPVVSEIIEANYKLKKFECFYFMYCYAISPSDFPQETVCRKKYVIPTAVNLGPFTYYVTNFFGNI